MLANAGATTEPVHEGRAVPPVPLSQGEATCLEFKDYRREKPMIENEMRPIHPGEILREEFLVPAGMTANALAKALRVDDSRINDIVRERRGITPDTALRLATLLQTSAEFWLNLQSAYDLKVADTEKGNLIRAEIVPLPVQAIGNSLHRGRT